MTSYQHFVSTIHEADFTCSSSLDKLLRIFKFVTNHTRKEAHLVLNIDMPGIIVSSSSSSASFEESLSGLTASQDYAANSFPGYAEKPLDEQLEPIAVVGMGKSELMRFSVNNISRMSLTQFHRVASGFLGSDDEQGNWPNSQSPGIEI